MSELPPEVCAECGFDGAEYDVSDALGTLRAVPPMWDELTYGLSDAVLLARPAPGVWSAAEYAAHSAEVAMSMAFLLEATLADGDVRIVDPVPEEHDPDVTRGPAAALRWLDQKVDLVVAAARSIGGDDAIGWQATVHVGGELFGDAGWILRHAVHDLTHHLADVGRGIHRLGAGAPTQHGTVAQLASGGGGVPKAPSKRSTSGCEASRATSRPTGATTGGRSRPCASGRPR